MSGGRDIQVAASNRRARRRVQPPTVTTTVQGTGAAGTTESFVVDISTIPFLRQIDVAFVGHSLRPQRRIFYYFDDVQVTTYVQRATVISIPGTVFFNDALGNSDRITYLANSAQLLNATVNPDTGDTDLYVANVVGTFPVGVTISSTSGSGGVISKYQHRHGTATGGGANSITLQADASTTTGYYVGNTIYLGAGSGLGQTGVIASYNGVSRVANVSTPWGTLPTSNTRYSIGDHYVERDGSTTGIFILPNQPALKFRAGERIFRVIDNGDNNIDQATCRADFRWLGSGLTEVKHNITVQSPPQPAPPPPAPTQPAPTPAPPRPQKPFRKDPVAQTFFIDEAAYPSGVFATSIDLFFQTKDAILPVIVQIRPVVNGFPHSTDSLKGSEVTLYPAKVNLSTVPDSSNSSTATTFTFPFPVYLQPGLEYAFVVLTDSLDYNIYVSELGKKIIGTNRIVSTQPYLGSLFKSQNGSTWTPIQEEDIMFVLKKAVFPVDSVATIDFYNQSPTANINVDSLYVYTSEDRYPNTTLNYGVSKDVGVSYANTITKETYDLDTRFVIPVASDGTFRVRGSLSTRNRDISPILYTEKFAAIGSENIINDLPLTNSSITITNGGTGYSTNANISVTIAGGGGTGANAKVDQISGGAIQSIIFNALGSGYTGQANVLISGGTAGTTATAVIAAETRPDGGLATTKYITRIITLAEGFDAGDIRSYITAYKPLTTEFHLYYKIRNFADPEPFSAKPWVLMTQATPTNLFSDSKDDLIEYEYRASMNTAAISYTTGQTTYDRFNQFAVKIVARAQSTNILPIAYDFRAIALPPSGY